MKAPEKARCILTAAVIVFGIAFIFYRSFLIAMLLTPLSFIYPKMRIKEIIKKRKKELTNQFKDMRYSLSSSLSAGKSVESAFKDVLKDISVLYPDSRVPIISETEYIIRKLEMNETIEAVFSDFAVRTDIEDIKNFADVFNVSKRTGGNVVEIIKNTSVIINDRIEVRQDIDIMLSERKFEQKILNIVPVGMLILLSVTAGDYMEPVFSTNIGRLVMTVSVILLIVAHFIAKHISNIKL